MEGGMSAMILAQRILMAVKGDSPLAATLTSTTYEKREAFK
jgi:hypothetical protein